MTTDTIHPQTHVELAAEIVSAYVSKNPVPQADLAGLLNGIHSALVGLTAAPGSAGEAQVAPEKPSAAQIRKSISQDGLISFIDGRSYKTLKRHLTSHGLTPERYRERFGLEADYPMTCPGYSQQRSALARAIGLGVPGTRAETANKKAA